MRHRLLFIFTLAGMVLAGCAEQFDENQPDRSVVPAGGDFELKIAASTIHTKTVADEYEGTVQFVEGDRINLFHAIANEQGGYTYYANDGCFYVTGVNEDGTATIKGYLSEDILPDQRYDWFAAYPYSEETTSPEKVQAIFPSKVIRHGEDAENEGGPAGSEYPLAGNVKGVLGSDVPVLKMKQFAAAIEVDVSNFSDEDLVVNTIEVVSNMVSIAGSYKFNTLVFERNPEDYNEYAWDEKWEEYAQMQSAPRFDYSVMEPGHKVTLNTGGVVVACGDVRPFFIPVAPAVFEKMGSDLSIKVNDVYKPLSMRTTRTWYGPQTSATNNIYIRQKFKSGEVAQFNFTYGFSDIETYPSTWTSLDENEATLRPETYWYNNSNLVNFLGCVGTAPAYPFEDSFSPLSYIWLQSNGYANPRIWSKTRPSLIGMSMWEDESFEFVIPVLHVSGGSKIAIETNMSCYGAKEADSEHKSEAEAGIKKWWYGGAACFACEYSLDQGNTWKTADTGDWSTKSTVPGANFVLDKVDEGCYLKALCDIPYDFDQKTFLYRMRVVHADMDVEDVLNGRTIGSRDVPNNPDQYNEPNTYQGQNTLEPFDGSKAGIYARVSVE